MARELPVISAEDAPPPFQRIAIVGFGLIGGSIALAARRRWRGGLIIAVDRKHVLEAAMRAHAADVAADDLGMLAGADLIVLAAPVRQNIALLERLPEYVSGEALVTDVGSTKQATVEAAAALPKRLRFVGGHPLAGAAAGGFGAARAELFDGRPWILTTDSRDAPAAALERFVSALGARPVRMAADEHDAQLAYLSHLPQLVASALMHVAGERLRDEGLALAGRGLRDTTRLAGSPPDIWRDIAATNAGSIAEALDSLVSVLRELRSDLGAGDRLQEVFESAAHWKQVLEEPRAE